VLISIKENCSIFSPSPFAYHDKQAHLCEQRPATPTVVPRTPGEAPRTAKALCRPASECEEQH
jgi:hypothetical protein